MNKIYIEVPKNTDNVQVSVPCRNGELLWSFQVIFTEIERIKTRIVTVYDNGCEDDTKKSIQSKIANNENYRLVEFDYEIDEEDSKMAVKISVFFSKEVRMLSVSW